MTHETAIQQTINRWSEGASRADWDQLKATLLPDAIWEAPAVGMKFVGISAIVATLKTIIAPLAYSLQANAPAVITIDGDAAAARSVIHESAKYADRDEALELLGFYRDALVLTAEGWKFAHRTYELVAMRSFALLPATPPTAP